MGQVVLGSSQRACRLSSAGGPARHLDQAIYDKWRQWSCACRPSWYVMRPGKPPPVIGALQRSAPLWCPGTGQILDGNHLAASDHRLEALRHTWAAPLPGQILVVLDQQPMLATEVVLCEDGHAQERSLLARGCLGRTRRSVARGSQLLHGGFFVWHCRARCCFVVRQHGQLKGTVVGARKLKGTINTGKVYEQKIGLVNSQGDTLTLRRITVALQEADP